MTDKFCFLTYPVNGAGKMDNHDRETRSYNMSRIRSTNTKPEEIVRKYLFSQGFRYKKNVKELPGKPDIVLPKYRAVIFVNGCFWHGHEGCSKFIWPKSNQEYWEKKLLGNIIRDKENYKRLEQLQWKVFIVWECQLKSEMKEQTLVNLCNEIKRTEPFK